MIELPRFSKSNYVLHLYRCYIDLQNYHKFSTQNGSNQVEGKKTATIIAYGKWIAYGLLLAEIDGWQKLIPKDEPGYIGPVHNGHSRNIID